MYRRHWSIVTVDAKNIVGCYTLIGVVVVVAAAAE